MGFNLPLFGNVTSVSMTVLAPAQNPPRVSWLLYDDFKTLGTFEGLKYFHVSLQTHKLWLVLTKTKVLIKRKRTAGLLLLASRIHCDTVPLKQAVLSDLPAPSASPDVPCLEVGMSRKHGTQGTQP